MEDYTERRSGQERRDWDVFVHPNRRSGVERRGDKNRRQSHKLHSPDRREQTPIPRDIKESKPSESEPPSEQSYYTTAEVADMTGLSQTTLLLWIRNKIIDGSRIKRSVEGRRLWTREDVEEIERVKERNGWTG